MAGTVLSPVRQLMSPSLMQSLRMTPWSRSCIVFVSHHRVDRRLSLRAHCGVVTPFVSVHFIRYLYRLSEVLITQLLDGIFARGIRLDGPQVFKDLVYLVAV